MSVKVLTTHPWQASSDGGAQLLTWLQGLPVLCVGHDWRVSQSRHGARALVSDGLVISPELRAVYSGLSDFDFRNVWIT